jgi:hypothetical protein
VIWRALKRRLCAPIWDKKLGQMFVVFFYPKLGHTVCVCFEQVNMRRASAHSARSGTVTDSDGAVIPKLLFITTVPNTKSPSLYSRILILSLAQPCHGDSGVCVYITAGPIIKLCAGEGGGQ